MEQLRDDLNYQKSWTDVSVEDYEGFSPNMNRHHTHSYYEISLILRGNVTVLLGDMADTVTADGSEGRLLLIAPSTPHFIIPEQGVLYARRNLLFSPAFLAPCPPEWRELPTLFGEGGCMIPAERELIALFIQMTDAIQKEASQSRKRFLLLYLLSRLEESVSVKPHGTEIPSFIHEALRHITEHSHDKLTAAALADKVHVGRTTLMTSFRRYTGMTIGEYLTRYRLRNAISLLREGVTEQAVAEQCGFGSAGYLIRVFRRQFGVTPREYLKKG